MERSTEIERKFEAPDGVRWSFGPLASLGPVHAFPLRARYYDTPDFTLVRGGYSLRRREGGSDEGWHFKTPRAGRGREELHWPLSEELPAALRDVVTGIVQTAPLMVVARLDTDRRERTVVLSGRPSALFVEDQVVATVRGTTQAWQEFELELLPGIDESVLDVLSDALLASGVVAAGHGSKVARALGLPTDPRPAWGPSSSAGDVLMAYAARQIGMLQARQPALAGDGPDAVHQSRVATRRLRSLLRTFAAAFDPAIIGSLSRELQWWGEVLGAARDAEVLLREFGELLAELGDAVSADERRGILRELEVGHSFAHAALVRELTTDRARELREALERFLVEPPFSALADQRALDVLPGLWASEGARVERLWKRAERQPNARARWHRVRKAAKAARYGAEVVALTGDPAFRAAADAWEHVTEALGVVQDAAVARDVLARWGDMGGVGTVLEDIQADRATAGMSEARIALAQAIHPGAVASDGEAPPIGS